MSKIKKKTVDRLTTISEEDIKLVKLIQFAGWIFLLAVGAYMGAWLVLDIGLEMSFIDIKPDEVTFAFLLFTGVSSAFCFGLSSKINNNRERKKEIFLDWLIGEFLFCLFAIAAIAVYQW